SDQMPRDEMTNAANVIGNARRKSRSPRMLDAISRSIAAMTTRTAAVGMSWITAGRVAVSIHEYESPNQQDISFVGGAPGRAQIGERESQSSCPSGPTAVTALCARGRYFFCAAAICTS